MATLVRLVFSLAMPMMPFVLATHRGAGISENYPWFSSRIVVGHKRVNSTALLASIDQHNESRKVKKVTHDAQRAYGRFKGP